MHRQTAVTTMVEPRLLGPRQSRSTNKSDRFLSLPRHYSPAPPPPITRSPASLPIFQNLFSSFECVDILCLLILCRFQHKSYTAALRQPAIVNLPHPSAWGEYSYRLCTYNFYAVSTNEHFITIIITENDSWRFCETKVRSKKCTCS